MAEPIRTSHRRIVRSLAVICAGGILGVLPASASAAELEFTGPTNFPVGSFPVAMVVGDFNGDSDPDLAVLNASDEDVSILLGAAGGTFTGPTDFSVGNAPTSIAVGQLNDDSDQDLVVANFLDETVSLLPGAAGGAFGGATAFPTAVEGCPEGVLVANFDSDVGAKPDVATVGDCDNFMTQGRVSILEGNGLGSLGAPTGIPVGLDDSEAIAVGEFNGDSDPDLVALNDNAYLLPGAAGLGFTGPTSFGQPQSLSVAIDDFDADGNDDAAMRRSNGTVEVARGSGSALMSTITVANPGSGNGLAAGDLNGDNDPDLALAHQTNAIAVLTGVGGSSFGFNGPTLYGAGNGPVATAIADFNGDGKRDIAVLNQLSTNVSVLLQPSPAVTPPTQPDTVTPPATAAPVKCKKKKKKRAAPAAKRCKKKKRK